MATKNKKQKEKVYFSIPLPAKRKVKVTKRLFRVLGLTFLGLFIVLSIGMGSGALNYAAATVRCFGLPVQTSDFMAAYTYRLPGEEGYGLSPLNSYKYCTKQEAEAGGYRPSVISEESRTEAAARQQAAREARRFSPEKVSYQVYVPVLTGYSVDEIRLDSVKGAQHTFMRIKKEGTVVGQIREVRADDTYNICRKEENPSEAYCQIIGNDSQGRDIKRYFRKNLDKWRSTYVGITIGDTGVILSSDNDAAAIQILNALQPYREGIGARQYEK